ncbi:hypothetical protein SNEBB_002275 [Seison nebaliae]|nr:hypothetical protein SNEBB_002275 [Seison nebaliae]
MNCIVLPCEGIRSNSMAGKKPDRQLYQVPARRCEDGNERTKGHSSHSSVSTSTITTTVVSSPNNIMTTSSTGRRINNNNNKKQQSNNKYQHQMQSMSNYKNGRVQPPPDVSSCKPSISSTSIGNCENQNKNRMNRPITKMLSSTLIDGNRRKDGRTYKKYPDQKNYAPSFTSSIKDDTSCTYHKVNSCNQNNNNGNQNNHNNLNKTKNLQKSQKNHLTKGRNFNGKKEKIKKNKFGGIQLPQHNGFSNNKYANENKLNDSSQWRRLDGNKTDRLISENSEGSVVAMTTNIKESSSSIVESITTTALVLSNLSINCSTTDDHSISSNTNDDDLSSFVTDIESLDSNPPNIDSSSSITSTTHTTSSMMMNLNINSIETNEINDSIISTENNNSINNHNNNNNNNHNNNNNNIHYSSEINNMTIVTNPNVNILPDNNNVNFNLLHSLSSTNNLSHTSYQNISTINNYKSIHPNYLNNIHPNHNNIPKHMNAHNNLNLSGGICSIGTTIIENHIPHANSMHSSMTSIVPYSSNDVHQIPNTKNSNNNNGTNGYNLMNNNNCLENNFPLNSYFVGAHSVQCQNSHQQLSPASFPNRIPMKQMSIPYRQPSYNQTISSVSMSNAIHSNLNNNSSSTAKRLTTNHITQNMFEFETNSQQMPYMMKNCNFMVSIDQDGVFITDNDIQPQPEEDEYEDEEEEEDEIEEESLESSQSQQSNKTLRLKPVTLPTDQMLRERVWRLIDFKLTNRKKIRSDSDLLPDDTLSDSGDECNYMTFLPYEIDCLQNGYFDLLKEAKEIASHHNYEFSNFPFLTNSFQLFQSADSSTYSLDHLVGLPEILMEDKQPTKEELKLTDDLKQMLSTINVVATDEEMKLRFRTLEFIENLVKEWTLTRSQELLRDGAEKESVCGAVYTFGSFRLGVHNKNADIDTICVVPRHIEREDFFESFVKLLKTQEKVKDVRAIEAFVPVIKFTCDGVAFDLLFARLQNSKMPPIENYDNDSILLNLKPECVRSLNGLRVACYVLKIVKEKESFKTALSFIKEWAMRNHIYSNAIGFLGGISWAILVARVCQLYPTACAATIIRKFFLIFSFWQWPSPVTLTPTYYDPTVQLPVWDPKMTRKDKFDVMPIITPTYPHQNSTYNVTSSSLKIILKEFRRAFDSVEKVFDGTMQWIDLFQPLNFFQRYKNYLVIVGKAETEEFNLEWQGLLESRLRHLVLALEQVGSIKLVHLHQNPYKHKKGKEKITTWALGLEVDPEKCNGTAENPMRINLQECIDQFSEAIMKYNQNWKHGQYSAHAIKRKDLIKFFPESVLRLRRRKKRKNKDPNEDNNGQIKEKISNLESSVKREKVITPSSSFTYMETKRQKQEGDNSKIVSYTEYATNDDNQISNSELVDSDINLIRNSSYIKEEKVDEKEKNEINEVKMKTEV